MNCKKCGQEIQNAEICHYCGTNQNEMNTEIEKDTFQPLAYQKIDSVASDVNIPDSNNTTNTYTITKNPMQETASVSNTKTSQAGEQTNPYVNTQNYYTSNYHATQGQYPAPGYQQVSSTGASQPQPTYYSPQNTYQPTGAPQPAPPYSLQNGYQQPPSPSQPQYYQTNTMYSQPQYGGFTPTQPTGSGFPPNYQPPYGNSYSTNPNGKKPKKKNPIAFIIIAIIIVLILIITFFSTILNNHNSIANYSNSEGTFSSKENSTVQFEGNSSIAEQVLFDQDGVKITATSLTSGENYYYDAKLNLLIENNTDRTIGVKVEDCAINGFIIYGSLFSEITSGKKANDSISFYESDLTQNGISEIGEIQVSFEIFDYDSYDTIATSDLITIETSAFGTTNNDQERGTVLYEQDGIVISYYGQFEKSEYGDYELSVLVENNTDKMVNVSIDDVSVNGFMNNGYLYSYLLPNTKENTTIEINDSDDEIDSIKEISFKIEVLDDNASYNDKVISDEITINF